MDEGARSAFRSDAGVQGARAAVKALWWTATGLAGRAVVRPDRARREMAPEDAPTAPPPPPRRVRGAWIEAFAKDYADVRKGLYPPSEALFSTAREALSSAGDFLKDAREVEARRRRGGAAEARDDAPSDAYPVYYRQNFHYQSGGWFTPESARRYEAQVEALFAGTAGAMRHRALALLAKAWRDRDQRGLKVVDLACGSGGFLRDLKTAFPRAAVFGLDLSPAYTAEAARRSGATVVQGAAERLPFAEASLDGISCIYLFHELPPRLRPVIAAEIARVLKPGGVLAFADSIQPADAPEFSRMLESFPVFFHEPYYASWREADVEGLFGGAGLDQVEADMAFLTKARLFVKR
jgi:ubiquinone/menaquinone biosynthesis C-methylase UbiE